MAFVTNMDREFQKQHEEKVCRVVYYLYSSGSGTLYPCWLQKPFREMKDLKIQISFEITDQICKN